jgi:hypothetical protein
MRPFEMTQSAVIPFRVGLIQVTLHMHIVFRARSSLKGIQTI